MEMMSPKRKSQSQEGESSIRTTTTTTTTTTTMKTCLPSNLPQDNPLLFNLPRTTIQTTTTTNPPMMSLTSTRTTTSAPEISSPTSEKPVSKPSPPNAPPKLALKKKPHRNQPPQKDPSHPFDQSVNRHRGTDGNQKPERRVKRLWMKCNEKRNGWQGIWVYDRKSRLQRKSK